LPQPAAVRLSLFGYSDVTESMTQPEGEPQGVPHFELFAEEYKHISITINIDT